MKILFASLMFLNIVANPDLKDKSGTIEGLWEIETYSRKGKTLKPEFKVHFFFGEGCFNEICYKSNEPVFNARFYNVHADIIQMYFDEDFEIKAEKYKISSISESELKLELIGDNFLVDNHSSQVFVLNRVNP